MNGGYFIVDLSGYTWAELGTGVTVTGIYERITTAAKPIMYKGLLTQNSRGYAFATVEKMGTNAYSVTFPTVSGVMGFSVNRADIVKLI